jgi:glycosyltransferase involved in cell wall biosynthesis
MRIALVTPQWKGTVGGPSNYTAALEHELRELGHFVAVLTTDSGRGAINIAGSGFSKSWRLFRALAALRPDIVHLQGRAHFIPSALLYRRRNPKSRVVFTFHTQPFVGTFVPSPAGGKPDYNIASRVIVSRLLRRCDLVTTVAQSIVDNLNRFYRLDVRHFETVPSGGSPTLADAKEVADFRLRHGLAGRFPILASVGVFSWDWKVAGHQVCIDAVGKLAADYPGILLLIAGDGQHKRLLQERVRERGLEQHVRFLGNVPNSGPVISAADLYVHMAMNEGCSLALVEAMHAGKPIVAARLGGNSEILEDGRTGRLISPDPDTLASTVAELLKDETKRESLALAAQIEARRSLTWAAVARRYDDVYRRILVRDEDYADAP